MAFVSDPSKSYGHGMDDIPRDMGQGTMTGSNTPWAQGPANLQLVFATSMHSYKVWEREGVSFSLSEAARYLMPFPYDLDESDTNAIS